MKKFVLNIDGEKNTRSDFDKILRFLKMISSEENIGVLIKNNIKENFDLNNTLKIEISDLLNIIILEENLKEKKEGTESIIFINSLEDLKKIDSRDVINFCNSLFINEELKEEEVSYIISFLVSRYPSLLDKLFIKSSYLSDNLLLLIDERLNLYLTNSSLSTEDSLFIENIENIKEYEEFKNNELISLKKNDMVSEFNCSNCRNRLCKQSPNEMANLYNTNNLVSERVCNFYLNLESFVQMNFQSLYMHSIINNSLPYHLLIESLNKMNDLIENTNIKIDLLMEKKNV